jgi:hypothetical protein
MNTLEKLIAAGLSATAAVGGVGWLGLQVKPANFPQPENVERDMGTMPLPGGLPEPVRRYYLAAIGTDIPCVETMAAWGRARMRRGVWMPLRYRLSHLAGRAFMREMEVTWVGQTLIKGVDSFTDGHGKMQIAGAVDISEKIDQGANMVLWAEQLVFMPSALFSHPRVRWEALDDVSARLVFPLGEGEDSMTVWFDAETALPTKVTALRYKSTTGEKTAWQGEYQNWKNFGGKRFPSRFAVTWEDEGSPWSYWEIEGVVFNAEVPPELR